jgi:hypothetical protein
MSDYIYAISTWSQPQLVEKPPGYSPADVKTIIEKQLGE